MSDIPAHAIAIIGMAGRFPRAHDLDEFWRNISGGVEVLDTMTTADMDAAGIPDEVRTKVNYVPKYTTLEDADHFDAGFFGMSPREAQTLDPQQRIFLECAWQALENAGYSPDGLDQSVGVYAGASMNTYAVSQLLRNPAFAGTVGGYQIMLGNDKDFLCTRVSYELNLRGPSLTIQTACSTSLVAVAVACQALHAGECELALAGGVSLNFPERTGYLYEEGMILSPDGHCRPFDTDARGTRAGAGVGIVVLKRLSDALADRDTVHAVIRGVAINNDGAGKAGYTAPSIDGQVEVIATAQALAGVDPRTISYIEAHGTGTQLGDPIEIAALTKVFRAKTADLGFCRIGSLKANIGHLDAAAGVASLIKTVLALKHKKIPPLVNFRAPNPQLELERGPFLASSQASPWTAAKPRRAGVSSFGIGGTNAHVVLEEAPPSEAPETKNDYQLLILSAKSSGALEQATKNLGDFLESNESTPLSHVAWTLQLGRKAFSHRRAAVVNSQTQAVQLLRQHDRTRVLTAEHGGGTRPVAFLFSGQGSQYSGMAAELYDSYRSFRAAVDECAKLLEPMLGQDIRPSIFTKSDHPLINETRMAQPALFVVEYALACLWKSWGVTPTAMLGHSIGEYTAAHLAGVMSLEDALTLVTARGRLMQALPKGSMAAVHCAPEQLRRWVRDGVEIAAINAPELCTISGPSKEVAEVLKLLKANNVDFRPLHTSHAFHSNMMEPALKPFIEILKRVELKPPRVPYVSNITGTWITTEQATSPTYYAEHLRGAVNFEAGVRTIANDPAALFLEVGPGNALATLARLSIANSRVRYVVSSLSHPNENRSDQASILDAAGRLWLAGVDLDWKNLHNGEFRQRVPLPTYPFERKRHWVEASSDVGKENESVEFSKDIADWIFAPTWTRAPSCASQAASVSGTWLVLAGHGALAEAVCKRLRLGGAKPILIEAADDFQLLDSSHFKARHRQASDISSIVHRIIEIGDAIQGAIYLGSNARDDVMLPYQALVALAEGLEVPESGPATRIIVATFGAESVLSEEVTNPFAAMMIGPVLALPTEVPNLRMRAVDLDLQDDMESIEEAATALVEEAANADLENLVAWRRGCRWMRRFERLSLGPPDPACLPIKQHGVYLITGGLGGIGLKLAHWFAANASARLILTARTALPAREKWDESLRDGNPNDRTANIIRSLQEMEDAGGEVLTLAVDVANFEQMKGALERIKKLWGPIDGVIHNAGVPGAGRISFLKEPEDIKAVVSPKLDGLDVLVRLLGKDSLDFFVLTSSMSSVTGAPGIGDYAGANAILDAFAESKLRPRSWKSVLTFDWGPWRDVGMAAKLFQRNLQVTIPPKSGVDIFARVLGSRNKRVVVAPYNLNRQVELQLKPPREPTIASDSISLGDQDAPQITGERPEISTAYEPPSTETERRLIEIWASLLGVSQIGIDDNFFELGGHSLLATRVLARISESMHVRLSLRNIFDAPTVRKLGAEIVHAAPVHHVAQISGEREEIEF